LALVHHFDYFLLQEKHLLLRIVQLCRAVACMASMAVTLCILQLFCQASDFLLLELGD